MAKVIQAFRERMHNMKRYNAGDDYPEENQERVDYLVKLGFLEPPKRTKSTKRKGGKSNANSKS